ncbi:hypothetical protein GC194_04445 [bacterium]|nr:hypothetical protein [bacterium]
MSIEYIPGEEIITQSENKLITLTNLRLRYHDSSWGRAHVVSMLLSRMASITVAYKSRPALLLVLVAGIFIASYGASEREDFITAAGLLTGMTGLLAYFLTRRHYFTIATMGGDIVRFHTTRMGRKRVIEFINQVERAALINDKADA